MDDKTIPYATLEFAVEKMSQVIKYLVIIIIILALALIGTNIAWVIYESQFETVACDIQTGDGGDANYIGNDGDIYNGESNSGEENQSER